MPRFVRRSSRVGNNLVAVIDEVDAAHAIGWAQARMSEGTAEEYALGATSLEDAYIRLIGQSSPSEESV